jgi:hypothetical protein
MRPTELVYSSHDRCDLLHRHYIVERAVENPFNRTVLYLPFSSGRMEDQRYSWGTFSWYFDRFQADGLAPREFFWNEELRLEDAEKFFAEVASSEVLILGGGASGLGIQRYAEMGRRFFDDPERFARSLQQRQTQGLLTVGFSAGADQLCEHCVGDPVRGYGLVRKVMVRLHFEHGLEGQIESLAREHPDCLVFGLPNDSGLAVLQGQTARGTFYQLIEFVLDGSWDKPEDQWHIRTRQGVKIEHRYRDGRDWKFNGGDLLLRVLHPDGIKQEAWIKQPHHEHFQNYFTQEHTLFTRVEDILHTM